VTSLDNFPRRLSIPAAGVPAVDPNSKDDDTAQSDLESIRRSQELNMLLGGCSYNVISRGSSSVRRQPVR
jgi:hypothetical protein